MDDPDHAKARRRYHHGDLRGALIAAGREILEEGGPSAVSLREAARRANVSHAAPRHHFESLRHFLGDCAADGFAQFDAALRAAAGRHVDPAEAMAEMARAYLRFALAHRAMFRIMFDRESFIEPTPALRAASALAHEALVEGVCRLAPAADAAWIDSVADGVWAIVHGYAMLALEGLVCAGAERSRPEDAAARATGAFLRGLSLNGRGASVSRSVAAVAVLVPDYDAAVAHYCGDLGFDLVEDADLGGGRRWVLVAPPGARETRLLLARADDPRQAAAVGDQAGGRVFLFLRTDEFDRDHARLAAAGVRFEAAPRDEPYGRVAVFVDAFGNRWDLIGPADG